jgi:hypothetical protein
MSTDRRAFWGEREHGALSQQYIGCSTSSVIKSANAIASSNIKICLDKTAAQHKNGALAPPQLLHRPGF